jgi:Fe-S cluster biosynthesis and repair protein YggX
MGHVQCVRCGQLADEIAVPVWGGKIGEEVKARICGACWAAWTDQQTKVINEYRLNLREATSREMLTGEMRKFLSLPAAL